MKHCCCHASCTSGRWPTRADSLLPMCLQRRLLPGQLHPLVSEKCSNVALFTEPPSWFLTVGVPLSRAD